MSIFPEVVQNDVFVHPAADGDQEEGLQVCPRSLSVQHIFLAKFFQRIPLSCASLLTEKTERKERINT